MAWGREETGKGDDDLIRKSLADDKGIVHVDFYAYSGERTVVIAEEKSGSGVIRVQSKDWQKGSVLKIFHVAPRPGNEVLEQIATEFKSLKKMVLAALASEEVEP